MMRNDVDARKEALKELGAPTLEGRKRRVALQNAFSHTRREFHGLGIEMGQQYTGSGVYADDECQTRPDQPTDHSVLHYEPSTYPGCRLPHVWLNKAIPGKPVSTIDLAGHGAFTLFTGIGGDPWKSAVDRVVPKLGVPVQVHSIGFRQDWEDVYWDWERVRGVEESGAVLVRPDRFVAWRAAEVLGDSEACETKLMAVMNSILGY